MSEPLISLLKSSRSVVISTHTRPDGDAVGSQLALGLFLAGEGKSVSLINNDTPPMNLEWLPGSEFLEVFDGSLDQRERIASADLLIVVDTNVEDRLGSVGVPFRSAMGKKILIDHHTGSEDWFDQRYSRETASSTAELVHELLTGWNSASGDQFSGPLDTAVATALYVGIMTDTGSFRFSNVTGHVHRVVADIIDRGSLDVSSIHSNIYDRRTPEGLRFLGRVLETITLHEDGTVGSMEIHKRMLSDLGVSVEEADGFVNYILSIEGIRVAMLFTETEKGTKVSFRSKGDACVHLWAQSLGGGGHRMASGAFLLKPLDEAKRIVLAGASRHVGGHSDVTPEKPALSDDDAAYLNSLMNTNTKDSL